MIDPRMTKLAENLINYSTGLKPGDKILIEAIDIPTEMTCELVRVARAAGGDPLVTLKSNRHPTQDGQAWCLRCNKVVEMVGPLSTRETINRMGLVTGKCSICGGIVNQGQ